MSRFTYIYDTYCGWCYGAAPVIASLIDSGAQVDVLHRHLFQGPNAHRMGDGFGAMAEKYDARIAALSGQPFSETYVAKILRDPDAVLDSTLTAWAAALVHDQGAKAEMALSRALQTARFVDGARANDGHAVQDAVKRFGITQPLSAGAEKADALSIAAQKLQQTYGASGVPALLHHTDHGTALVNIADYYKTPETIATLVA